MNYGPARLWLDEPRMPTCGCALVPLEMRADADGRVLHRLQICVPPLAYPAKISEAAARVRGLIDPAIDAIVQSYMATTRGLPA